MAQLIPPIALGLAGETLPGFAAVELFDPTSRVGGTPEEILAITVAIALSTHGLAAADDELPADDSDRGGWWADAFEESGFRVGSRAWLGSRSALTTAEIERYRERQAEALAFLVAEGLASEVAVTATRIAGAEGVELTVTIDRGEAVDLRYAELWRGINA